MILKRDVHAIRSDLTERKVNVMKHAKELFSLDGVELEFDEGALNAIAEKTLEKKTGARGLRSIIEGFMMRPMYEFAGRNDIEELTVTEAFVKGLEDINIKYRKNTEALPEADTSKKAV